MKINLQCQQQGEGQFVGLIQTPHSVLEHLIGHVVNDVLDAFLRNGGLMRPANTPSDISVYER